jgi:hypothetical protein
VPLLLLLMLLLHEVLQRAAQCWARSQQHMPRQRLLVLLQQHVLLLRLHGLAAADGLHSARYCCRCTAALPVVL